MDSKALAEAVRCTGADEVAVLVGAGGEWDGIGSSGMGVLANDAVEEDAMDEWWIGSNPGQTVHGPFSTRAAAVAAGRKDWPLEGFYVAWGPGTLELIHGELNREE